MLVNKLWMGAIFSENWFKYFKNSRKIFVIIFFFIKVTITNYRYKAI